jgi:hypothetical protein
VRPRLKKVLDALFSNDGSWPDLRRAAVARAATLSGGALPAAETASASETLAEPLAGWVDKVARQAWKITDEDVAALRAAGFAEDAIFEITIAAAAGAGLARYQVAVRAIEAAASAPLKSGTGG